MAQYFNNLFGGSKSSAAPIPSGDADFADFVDTPSAAVTGTVTTQVVTPLASSTATTTPVPFTKWYNVHERHSLQEFQAEGLILILMVVVLGVHFFGATRNRSKARGWIKAHQKTLASEFAIVGFGRVPKTAVNSDDAADQASVVEALAKKTVETDPKLLIKENSLFEFSAYATGRQNVAFMDIKINLVKRFNPFVVIAESILSFFMDSMPAPEDSVEAILYPFDGKEALTIPGYAGSASANSGPKSSYDGFVWAIVNKERMKEVRDERFDVSITFTKDNAKLPPWLTVMSESAEITNQLLTPELIQAAEAAGEQLDYLIISDQPIAKPTTIEETEPKKRVFLKYRLPSNGDYTPLLPIFSYFVRSIDVVVQNGRLRPEILRKLKSIREDVVKQIKKAEDEEKAEERAIERERLRKVKRDAELNALDAKAQKKYLERERERELRKSSKRSTMRA